MIIMIAIFGWVFWLIEFFWRRNCQEYIEFLKESRDFWKVLAEKLAQKSIDKRIEGDEWKDGC